MSVKPGPTQHLYYLKYVLMVRMLKDELGADNETVNDWIVVGWKNCQIKLKSLQVRFRA